MANIRTQDYQGWNAASSSVQNGWMLWSGSCADVTASNPSLTTNYIGLGAEFVHNSESYLRWSSSDAGNGLDIRTNRFFVGNEQGSYIQGYGNTVIIGSNNFTLDEYGNVTMQGTITATEGDIAGWKIMSDKLLSKGGTASAADPGIVIGSGGTIETNPFVSGLTANATGWQIRADGRAEFENAVIRGTLSTAVFEKDTISVVGGQVMVANATKTDSPELRFQPYPHVKTPTGRNHNYSGEVMPPTGSGNTSGEIFLSYTGSLSADHVINSNLWWKIASGNSGVTSNGKLNLPISHSSDPVGTKYRITWYGASGSSVMPLISTWDNNKYFQYGSGVFGFTQSDGTTGTQFTANNPINNVDQVNTLYFRKEATWGTGSNNPVLIIRPSGTPTDGTFSYIRDIHIIRATHSIQVDNAGGFQTGSEILVAKAVDQGPDGREGFVREYMLCVSKSLGKSAVPASASVSFGSGLPSQIAVTASETHLFIGQTGSLSTDTVYNNTYYYASSSILANALVNLKQKINAEVKDVFVNTTGSVEGTIDALYMQAVGAENLDGNAYKLHTTTLGGAEAQIKPIIGVERNMDSRVPGNERGYWIENISDGQTIASQGGEGTGYILLNAQPTDTYTPYIDIVERKNVNLGTKVQAVDVNGYPTDMDSSFGEVSTVARLGDLSGITDYAFSDGVSGYGLYTTNGYFRGKIEVGSLPNFPTIPSSLHYNFMGQTGSKVLNRGGTEITHGSGSIVDVHTYTPWSSQVGSEDFSSVTGNSAYYFSSSANNYIQGTYRNWYYDGAAVTSSRYDTGNTNDRVSISMWVKPKSSTKHEVLWEVGGGGAGNMLWRSGSVLGFSIWESSGNTVFCMTQSCITEGQWNHVGVVWDTGTGSLYQNGIRKLQEKSVDGLGLQLAYSGYWGVGAVYNNSRIITSSISQYTGQGTAGLTDGDYGYTGSMDELKVWFDYPLTDKEMEALYMYPNGDTAGGGTIIEGSRIQTGKIQSNNWSATSGSELDLDDSRIRLGGSTAPKLHWDPDTNTLFINGQIQIGQGSTLPDGSPIDSIKTIQITGDSNIYAFASASDTTPDNDIITVTVQQTGMTAAVTKSDFTFTTANSTTVAISSSAYITSSFSSGSGESSFKLSYASSSVMPHLGGDKNSLPLTIGVEKSERTDAFTIVALDGGVQGAPGATGSSGSAGIDARTVHLTIPNQIFEYDTAGANPSPATTGITASAFNTNSTAYYTFYVDNVSVQANSTSSTYLYTPPNTASNMPQTIEVELREAAGAGTPIYARDEESVVGIQDGSGVMSVDLSQEHVALSVSASGEVNYANTNVDIRAWDGITDLVNKTGQTMTNNSFQVTASATGITLGTATANTYTQSYGTASAMTGTTATANFSVRCRNAAGQTQTIDKQMTFNKTVDGLSAMEVWLDPAAVVLPSTASSGVCFDFNNSGANVYVAEGTQSLDFIASGYPTAGQWKVVRTPVDVLPGAITDAGDYASAGNISQFSASVSTGSIGYLITGKRAGGAAFTSSLTQSFAKAAQGVDGVPGNTGNPGVSARAVEISSSNYVFTYPATGTGSASPAQTILHANVQNATGSVYYQWFIGANSQGGASNTASQFTYQPQADIANMPQTVAVKIRDGSATNDVCAEDQQSMLGLKSGGDSINILLSQDQATVPVSGGTTDYSNTPTTIKVWRGANPLPHDQSSPYALDSFRVGIEGKENILEGAITSGGTYAINVGAASAFSASTSVGSVTYSVVVIDDNQTAATFSKVQSMVKAFSGDNGAPGTNARMVSMSLKTQYDMLTYTYDEEGANPTPASTSFTCASTGSEGTPYYTWYVTGSAANATPGTAADSGSFIYYPPATFSTMPQTVKVDMRDGSVGAAIVSQDHLQIQGVKLGRGPVGVENVNSAHVLPANAAGVVTSHAGSGTVFRATYNGQYVPYSANLLGTPSFRLKSSASTNITPATPGNQSVLSTYYYVVGNASGMNNSYDSASIDWVLEVKNAAGGVVETTSSQTFTKAKQGVQGLTGDDGNEGLINAYGAVTFSHNANSNGLYLGSQSLGFYTTSLNGGAAGFASYLDNQGQLYLKGKGGSGMSWANDRLLIDGEVRARAIQQIPIIIDSTNYYEYAVTHSQHTVTEGKCCTIYLDGRVTSGSKTGVHDPNATPDPQKMSKYVIFKTNAATISNGSSTYANSLPSIVHIVPPDLLDDGYGGSDNICEITLEVDTSVSQRVEFIAPTQSVISGNSGWTTTQELANTQKVISDNNT